MNNKKILVSLIILCLLAILTINIVLFGNEQNRVLPGVDVFLEDYLHLVKGKRVGLITNPTGVTSDLKSTIDCFHQHPQIELVALFGPEHGVRGNYTAGAKVANAVDDRTGIPMYSLYGSTRKPTPEMLRDVDILFYDIQDIGIRPYTYIYTMAYGMEAAAEKGIPFVVLDRPNPLGGGLVEGPILDPKYKSFVGLYPIPYIYGMTCGELARLFNQEFDINVDLTVVPLKGWERQMTFKDTGLEWVPTSPHIPHGKTAYFCAATGVIGELHTIDIGVGYTSPFELIGERWIDPDQLAAHLNKQNLPGVSFRPTYYTPYYFINEKEHLNGVQIHITDIDRLQPMRVQLHILAAIRALYPEQQFFDTNRAKMFDKTAGTDRVRKAIWDGKDPDQMIRTWQSEVAKFRNNSKQYFLYK